VFSTEFLVVAGAVLQYFQRGCLRRVAGDLVLLSVAKLAVAKKLIELRRAKTLGLIHVTRFTGRGLNV